MKTITYNLAATRKVNGRSFAVRAAILALAALVFASIALSNWNRLRAQGRAAASKTGATGQRLSEMKNESSRLNKQITTLKKSLTGELKEANNLIRRKSFSFLSRLDFLEKNFSPGIRILHLTLANDEDGRIVMTITAQSLKELFALYKKLAPYGLVITNETQTHEEYQVKLNFKVKNEQI